MFRRPPLRHLAVAVCLLVVPVASSACTCALSASAKPIKTMRGLAASQSQTPEVGVIFEGFVEKQEVEAGPIGPPQNAMSMTPNQMHRVVTMRVIRVYRGSLDVEKPVEVLTGMGTGDCGFDFETGKQYLVYADKVGPMLFTSICTGTSLVEQSGFALRFLRGEAPDADDLLDPQSYYAKYFPRWTGSACGQVTKPDGSPLAQADVEFVQFRPGRFPPKIASDPNLAKPDGSFCVSGIDPGRYLLTTEWTDYDANIRWRGYYPGVVNESQANIFEIHAGENLPNLRFAAQKQNLYTITFHFVTKNGSKLPWSSIVFALDSAESLPLGYHELDRIDQDGSLTLGLIPPGRYTATVFAVPDSDTGEIPKELVGWKTSKQEISITAGGEVMLKLPFSEN